MCRKIAEELNQLRYIWPPLPTGKEPDLNWTDDNDECCFIKSIYAILKLYW